jgi:integrase
VRKEYPQVSQKIYDKTEDGLICKLYDVFCRNLPVRKTATLRTLFEDWMKERENDPDVQYQTLRKNQCDWNTFISGSGIIDVPISKLTVTDVNSFFKDITAGKKMTRKAFNNVRSILNALYDIAIEDGQCGLNLSRMTNPSHYKFKPTDNSKKIYTTEERDRILNALADSMNIYDKAVMMMFCLGCRVGEVKALKWKDIDWQKQTVYICRELVEGKDGQEEKQHTKSGMTEGNRSVPLSERAVSILVQIPRTMDDNQYVFQKDLKPLRTESINTHLRDCCRRLGITYLSSHKIRSWAITEMVKAGVDEATIMYMAGHSSKQTMETYIRLGRMHLDNEKLQAVLN